MYKFVAILLAMQMVNVFAQEYIVNGKAVTREDLLAMVKDGLIGRISVDTLDNRVTGSETVLTQQSTAPVEKKTTTTTTETVSRPVEQPVINKIIVENKPADSFLNPMTPNVVAPITVTPQAAGTETILAPAPVQKTTTTTTTTEFLNLPTENKNINEASSGFLKPIPSSGAARIQTASDIVLPKFSGNVEDDAFLKTTNKDTVLTETPAKPSNGFLIDQLIPVQPKVKTTQIITTPEIWRQTAHLTTEEELKQARNAKYQFGFLSEDGISRNYQQRAETRENGVVRGVYSYDDGFIFRRVEYEADVNGFRITKQENFASRMKSATGQAHVQTVMDGGAMEYFIGEKDINGFSRKAKLTPEFA